MACCDWATFCDSLLATWRKKKAGELLIDWDRAKTDWARHHCTGGEAAKMQLQMLARESDYLWLERVNKNRRDDDGGIACPAPVPA